MSAKEDGGPAFPIPQEIHEDGKGDVKVIPSQRGMSLRDYIAIKALVPLIGTVNGDQEVVRDGYIEEISERATECWMAYEYADAMLAARRRG